MRDPTQIYLIVELFTSAMIVIKLIGNMAAALRNTLHQLHKLKEA